MDCRKAEDIARRVLAWTFILFVFVGVNAVIIGASLDVGKWWLGHAIIGTVFGGCTLFALGFAWVLGDINICRRK